MASTANNAPTLNALLVFAVFFVSASSTYVLLQFVPAAKDLLALYPERLFSGEVWRLLTYQFVHYDYSHLLQNLVALLLSVLLALELRSDFSTYSVTYLFTGVLAILPMWFVSPFLALGASTAIYGSFGFLSRASVKFSIKPYILLAIVTLLTAVSAAYTLYAVEQANPTVLAQQFLAHISGLFFGYYFCLLVFAIQKRYAAKKMTCLRTLSAA